MSQKALKRKIRRGTEDSDTDFKLPAHYTKKDSLNTSDDGVKTRQNHNGSGSNFEESDSDDNVALKNLANPEDNGTCDSASSRSRSATPKIQKPQEAEDGQQAADRECPNGNHLQPSNGQEESPKGDEDSPKAVELEPLMLDAEDPELMFPEEESESDLDFSDKGSPVLSRSVTRRSHTRNIPTPKTPKSAHDQNGSSEAEQSALINPTVCAERLPQADRSDRKEEGEAVAQEAGGEAADEDPDPADKEAEQSSPRDDVTSSVEAPEAADPDLTLDSCVSASESNESMLANVTGDDATRNIDFSCRDPSLVLDESADSLYKSRSVRSVSSRRSIRPNAEDVYRRRAFHNAQDVSLERISAAGTAGAGVKRKQRSETPDGPKRYKLEPAGAEGSPGFLAYLSGPIVSIRNRFSRARSGADAPVLKGYRPNVLLGADGDAQEQQVDETGVAPERKWCAIM